MGNKNSVIKRLNDAMGKLDSENKKIREEKKELEKSYKDALGKWSHEKEMRAMEEMARKMEDDARRRVEGDIHLQKQAEDNLKKGIILKYPTGAEIQAIRKIHNYQEGNLHCAITGVSGSGKSSLVNAFLGYKNSHKNAAKTGTIETTNKITRYDDPARETICWYDVPGAGTLKVPDWQYFNDQGLYIFNIIIITVDIRFTETDIALLLNCKRFGIPTFVIRSKANQNIQNTMNDDDDDEDEEDKDWVEEDEGDDDGDDDDEKKRYERAREKYIKSTRQEFDSILDKIGLAQQKVYIVSNDTLHSLVKGKPSAKVIDEVELIKDILKAANERNEQSQVIATD